MPKTKQPYYARYNRSVEKTNRFIDAVESTNAPMKKKAKAALMRTRVAFGDSSDNTKEARTQYAEYLWKELVKETRKRKAEKDRSKFTPRKNSGRITT